MDVLFCRGLHDVPLDEECHQSEHAVPLNTGKHFYNNVTDFFALSLDNPKQDYG